MALIVSHAFVSSVTDSTAAADAGEVLPSNWNASHVISGELEPDNSTITASAGVISATTATTSQLGVVKPDGSTITIAGGVITAAGGAASLTVNSSPISGGSAGQLLYDNGGTLEETATTYNSSNGALTIKTTGTAYNTGGLFLNETNGNGGTFVFQNNGTSDWSISDDVGGGDLFFYNFATAATPFRLLSTGQMVQQIIAPVNNAITLYRTAIFGAGGAGAAGLAYQREVQLADSSGALGNSFFENIELTDATAGATSVEWQIGVLTGGAFNYDLTASLGSVVAGHGAASTSATDGFLYIPTCAGTPTGTPTAYTGRIAMVYDTTNHQFWFYDGGWKQPKTPAAAAIITWQ